MADTGPEPERRAQPYPFAAPPEPVGWSPHGRRPVPIRTDDLAVVAFVLALTGLVTCGLTSIAGALCGHASLRRIRGGGGRLDGEELARAGVIAGWIIGGLALACWMLIAFGFALSVIGNR